MKIAIDALAYLRTTLFLSLLLSFCGAQPPPPPPPNDSCSGATPVTLGSSIAVSAQDATFDPNLENLCNGDTVISSSSPGVCYTFQGTGGRVAIILKHNTAAASVATFTGTCGASTLQCTSPDRGFLLSSYALTYTLQTVANTTYYLLMQQVAYIYAGTFNVSINSVPPSEAVNDVCLGAIPIGLNSIVNANFTFATPDQSAVTEDCAFGPYKNVILRHPGLWYTFQGERNGRPSVGDHGYGLQFHFHLQGSVWLGHTHVCSERKLHQQLDDSQHGFRDVVYHVGAASVYQSSPSGPIAFPTPRGHKRSLFQCNTGNHWIKLSWKHDFCHIGQR
jgi:hypothetical protein